MSEQTLMAWFASHPFTRSLIIAAVGGVAAMVKADWSKFQTHKAGEPDATWSLRIALGQYLQGIALGIGPLLSAELFKVLGILGS